MRRFRVALLLVTLALLSVAAFADTESFTIGNPGDFTSVFQALGGGWWNRPAPPHVEQPQAWLTSVTAVKPDPIATEYPGASQNEARGAQLPAGN